MTFQDKEVNLQEFLSRARERLVREGGDTVLFDGALIDDDRLKKEVQKMFGIEGDWDGIVSAGDFDNIYPLAAGMVRELASGLYSEAHLTIYDDAEKVSKLMGEELNETFEASGEHLFELGPIKSWADMMAEAGLVTIENGMVYPVPPEQLGLGRAPERE